MKRLTNSQIKHIKEISCDKKVRDEKSLFLAEGTKLISDCVKKKFLINLIVISNGFTRKISNKKFIKEAEESGIAVYKLSDKDFSRLSHLANSQGILAVIRKPKEKKLVYDKKSFFVVLDGVQDPGNMGTMIRTSAAFGASGIILTGESVDVYNPKVIRATSGMVLDLPIYRYDYGSIDLLKKDGFKVFVGCVPSENVKDINTLNDFNQPVLLVFGSEGKGVSKAWQDNADQLFYIPIKKEVESLNVAAACAVSLYVISSKISN